MANHLMMIDAMNIDEAGTRFAKVCITDLTSGKKNDEVREEWGNLSLESVANSLCFDYDNNHHWDLIFRCVEKALGEASIDAKEIAFLSATSWTYSTNGTRTLLPATPDDKITSRVKEKFGI